MKDDIIAKLKVLCADSNTISTSNYEYAVQYNEPLLDRLWVHCSTGETVARYSIQFGIELNSTIGEQTNGAHQCLMCTHSKSNTAEFEQFCDKVKELWDINIDKTKIQFN